MQPLNVVDLGLPSYEETQILQVSLRHLIATGEVPPVLLLLEHPPVITLGSRGGMPDVPHATDDGQTALHDGVRIPIIRSERGGAATLHAPGQLVSYPLLPIPGRDLRRFVHDLEEVLALVLARYDITPERRVGAPGLYVGELKICSVGLRCERWVASHGTSLNVSIDLSLFDLIVSCGETGLRQTSILQITGLAPPMDEVKEAYAGAFSRVFAQPLHPIAHMEPGQVEAALRKAARDT